MQSKPPKVIIATTTLAQGVNVGVSSVIVATPYISKETIDKRDFWNICGRAGRAFVDGEGKILYAIDDTRERWQIDKDERLARYYFDAKRSDRVESGLLFVVKILRKVASAAGVAFDLLLEVAANNDFARLGENAGACEQICDLLDDELLALHTIRWRIRGRGSHLSGWKRSSVGRSRCSKHGQLARRPPRMTYSRS